VRLQLDELRKDEDKQDHIALIAVDKEARRNTTRRISWERLLTACRANGNLATYGYSGDLGLLVNSCRSEGGYPQGCDPVIHRGYEATPDRCPKGLRPDGPPEAYCQ
jgi:hypothetical protein